MALTLPHEAMTEMFEALPSNDLPAVPNYNICPTTQVHAVTSEDGTRRLQPMRWGFLPHWYKSVSGGPLLINARSETIAEKPAFSKAVRARRALVVASGFYEWKRVKGETPLPWYVTRTDQQPMVFGAIWQDWSRDDESHRTVAIVTTAANDVMAPVHHRLPLVLNPDDWPLWLGENGKGAATLMHPAPDDLLQLTPVSTAVNSNRASGPDLITPVDRQ